MKIDQQALVKAAVRAAAGAYAPYSSYPVGAALLGASGTIHAGCNVENASYGLTMCAERVAVGKAVSDGERVFAAIAVCTAGGGAPCGACRQVLYEFAPELPVIMADLEGTIVRMTTLSDLLPGAFGPQDLEAGA